MAAKSALSTVRTRHRCYAPRAIAEIDSQPESVFICSQCDRTFQRKNDLVRHHSLEHANPSNPLQCVCCRAGFPSRVLLSSHMRFCQPQKEPAKEFTRFVCAQCFSMVSCKETMIDHMFRRHPESAVRQFECSFCTARFRGKIGLSLHLRVRHTIEDTKPLAHEKPNPFKCSLCPADYKTSTGLRMHINACHDKAYQGRFRCDKCPASFWNIQILRSHLLVHSDRRAFKCACCPFTCKRSRDLAGHLRRMHYRPKDERFECKQCPALFQSECGLRTHSLSHLGPAVNKRFPCQQCPAAFKTNDGLKQHLWCHRNETFRCPQCGATFNRARNRNRHVQLLHSSQASFGCATCEARFRSTKCLAAHIKRMHCARARRLACARCLNRYGSMYELRKHIANIHCKDFYACSRCSVVLENRMQAYHHFHLIHKATWRLRICLTFYRKLSESADIIKEATVNLNSLSSLSYTH